MRAILAVSGAVMEPAGRVGLGRGARLGGLRPRAAEPGP